MNVDQGDDEEKQGKKRIRHLAFRTAVDIIGEGLFLMYFILTIIPGNSWRDGNVLVVAYAAMGSLVAWYVALHSYTYGVVFIPWKC